MYRFVAFSWNAKNPEKSAATQRLAHLLVSSSPSWQCVLDTPGLRVFHAPHPGGACHAYVLKHNAGVVLGKLFSGSLNEDRNTVDLTFDDKGSALLIESQGRRLVDEYWGHYVAFLRTADGGRRFVLRDPTGGLPCYTTNANGIDIFLCDIADSVRLNLPPFSINWNHLTSFFLYSRLVTRTTGFVEVTQLLGGECLAIEYNDIRANITRSFYWNPVEICESACIEDVAQAREVLRTAIRHCVIAWGSSYKSILHQLSGGLDSSIVATCLGSARVCPNILCFHFFTKLAGGDERPYARAAAHHADLELIERECPVSERSLENQLERSMAASPALVGFLPASELFKRRLAAERRAGATFSGQGGDHLFQQRRSAMIAAEYAHRHGLRPELLRIARDTSRMTRQSIWSVTHGAVGSGLLRWAFDPYADIVRESPILSNNARASVSPEDYVHPWVADGTRLPASKMQQIFDVVDCQVFYLVPRPYSEQVHPLISQPIVERCLRIPSYVLTYRGRPRGLVRDAFEGDMPAKIIDRYSKGGTTSYFNEMLVENADFLRELLLDGHLVRERVLDRRKLEDQVSERELILGKQMVPLLNAARAETWLSNWANVRRRTAA